MSKLMERFTLAENRDQLNRVDQLFGESFTRDDKVRSKKFAEMRDIMKFTDFVGFNDTFKAVVLWRALSRRKLAIQERGIVVGSKVRNVLLPKKGIGVVTAIRGDFVLKISREDDGVKMTAAPQEVVLT